MATLDIAFVQAQFPAFSEPSLKEVVFLENAGGSYMCRQVIDRLNLYYTQCKVQPYYPNPVSTKAGDMMSEAYGSLSKWLNVSKDDIYFGPSTSQNTYTLAQACLGWLTAGDEIIVTNQDHEANGGVWRRLKKQGIEVKEWQVAPTTGSLDINDLKQLISSKTKLITFPHCSNILGEINPVAEICHLAEQNAIRTVVDGVSFAGHGLPDVTALGADVYLFSLYKVYGPHQGVMVMRKSMADQLSSQGHFFNKEIREKRFSSAGPDHAQQASVKGVDDYFESLYAHHFDASKERNDSEKATLIRELLAESEQKTLAKLLNYIEEKNELTLLGPSDVRHRAATVSVLLKGKNPLEMVALLGSHNIICGAGHFYSVRLLEAMEINTESGVLRFSLTHYTSQADVDRLIEVLEEVL